MLGFLVGASAMFATMYSTQAILPTIGRTFGVEPSRAGLTISVLVLAMVLGAWMWGPLSDRVGRRRCLIAASALLVPATIAVAVAPTFEVLIATRFIQGLILPGLLVVGLPYVSEVFVPAIGARAMGWYMASLISGGLIGRLGVALVASVTGWRVALGVLSVLPLVAVGVMSRTLPPAPARHKSVRTGVFSYIGYRLEAAPFNLSPTITSLVFVVWIAGAVAPIAGRRAERHGWSAVALVGAIVASLGLALTVPDHMWSIVAGLMCITVGMFIVVTAAPIGVGGARGVRPGAASALYYSIYYFSGAVGAFVPGLAWQRTGWAGVVGVSALAMMIALVGALVGRADERGRRVRLSTIRAAVVRRLTAVGWPS
jgi:YNFM family putative membrane transporter